MKQLINTFLFIPLLLFSFVINAETQQSTKHNIGIKKFKFTPAEITIEVGDSIRWTNNEKRQYHSVWFEELGEPEPDYLFPKAFYDRIFKEAGDFPYRCGPHPKMKGVVHVIEAAKDTKNTKKPLANNKEKEKTTYRVESVEDGDTLVINYKGKPQRVQLIGIDAPEDTQNPKLNIDSKRKQIEKSDLLEMGKLATEHLKTLVAKGEKVRLLGNLTQKDKYGRLPAVVVNEKGESLNQKMVASGYALLLTRFPIKDDLKKDLEEAQKKAKIESKGLWGTHSELMKKWSK